MLNVLLCILILAALGSGAYYAAQYVVKLQMMNKELLSDFNEAKKFIEEQAEVITSYEFERGELQKRLDYKHVSAPETGWNQFDTNR